MSQPVEFVDAWDHRRVPSSVGLLATLNDAGLLQPVDIHVAGRLSQLAGEADEAVILAAALAVRSVSQGSVCVDLASAVADIQEVLPDLVLPDPQEWLSRVDASPLATTGALKIEFGLLYLERYHHLERQVCADLLERSSNSPPPVDEAVLAASLDRVFPATGYDEQRLAAARAARAWTTVLTGGPGTGKTTTVAGLLSTLLDQAKHQGVRLSIALTAPTGKATARLSESVQREVASLPAGDQGPLRGLPALTLHRLLGWVPGNATRFKHDRSNRLKYDVIVVDETSMVDLLMMGRLLEAVRPEARLILVGDADQLSSVGAGAVLADLVAGFEQPLDSDREPSGPDSLVVSLRTTHRFGAEIGDLATALRIGDADAVVAALRAGGDSVEFIETGDPAEVLKVTLLTAAIEVRAQALSGDAEAAMVALNEHRLICAHRDGPYGVAHWNRQVERWLAEEAGQDYWPPGNHGQWYAGRPLLVTRNDYALGIYNGEIGVCVQSVEGPLRGLISGSERLLDFATTRLTEVTTMHAMTVHKSQGSQAKEVTVLLPPEDSRLLTRELLYTAVTRAQQRVRLVGSEAEVRAAVARQAVRATGLRQRLQSP